jgi:hypothetical protein
MGCSRAFCLVALVPLLGAILARVVIRSSGWARVQIAVGLMGWDGVGEIARETFAQRWLGQKMTSSRREFLGLLDALAEADEKYLSPTGRAVVHPDNIAEGHKYLSHLLRTGFETLLEQDARRPAFRKLVAADRKILGDNPDAFYYCSNLDKSLAYIVEGTNTGEDYFSLTVYTAPCEGCFFKDTIADINDRAGGFSVDRATGQFKVWVSASPPPEAFDGDWMNIAEALERPEATAFQLVTRHYYERETSVCADPLMEGTVNISISLAGGDSTRGFRRAAPRASVPADAEMARKLKAVSSFVRKHSTELEQDPTEAPKWFSFTLNEFGNPAVFRDENTGGVGAVDIAYSAAPFKLAPDEALVIRGTMPACAFANVVLWNRYLQTFDYVDRQTSLNRKQMRTIDGQDQEYAIVLSHTDPGRPSEYDWLDTMGRSGGTVFWRFLLPEGNVTKPQATVVKLSSLSL